MKRPATAFFGVFNVVGALVWLHLGSRHEDVAIVYACAFMAFICLAGAALHAVTLWKRR